MSQGAVAQAMGTSQSAVARIESGQENITLDTLQRLVVALKGRFDVSIPPQEHAPLKPRQWWDLIGSTAKSWEVTRVIGRRGIEADQVIIGLERDHTLSLGTVLLPQGKTTTSTGMRTYAKEITD